jgi:hypothetical protein
MQAPDTPEIEALQKQIEALRQRVEATAASGRAALQVTEPALQEIQLELSAGFSSPPSPDDFPESQRASIQQRLLAIRDFLAQAISREGEEPLDPSNFMYRQYASTCWIVALTVLGGLSTLVVLLGILGYWHKAASPHPSEREVLWMVVLMGSLGGCLHWTSSLAQYIGNAQLFRRWIPYYLLMPFEQMLADVFNTIFAKVRGKDQVQSDQATRSAPTSTAASGTRANG